MCGEYVSRFQLEEDVLAAPADTRDEGVLELMIESSTRDAGRDALEIQFGGEDAATCDEWRQGANDVFYFGKLRHKTLARIYKIFAG